MKSMKGVMAAVMAGACVCAGQAADGTWVKQSGVGTGGTNWADWSDTENWSGGTVASGDDSYAQFGSAGGQYISITNDLTLIGIRGSSTRPVLRSDATLSFTCAVHEKEPYLLELYAPCVFTSVSEYYGVQSIRMCGPTFGPNSPKIPIIRSGMEFRYDRYATAAGGTRSITEFEGLSELSLNVDAALKFIAPKGTVEAITARWSQTEGSPFLSRAAGQAEHDLPVGTVVTGAGIPDGTFLKRVFPDGTIELSAAAATTAADNELTFAALTADVTVTMPPTLRAWCDTGANASIYVQKYREADSLTVKVNRLKGYTYNQFTVTTETGMVPGVLEIGGTLHGYSGRILSVALENCHLKLGAGPFAQSQFLLPGAAHVGRITVDEGDSPSVVWANLTGRLVKDGAGKLTATVTADGTMAGTLVVEAGTFAIVGTEQVGTVELKAGATLEVPAAGLAVENLIVADGAIISGGRVTAGTVTGDASKLVLKGGASVVDATPSTDLLDVELVSGVMRRLYEDGDEIVIVPTNSLLRFTGSGTADILVVGGGGGAGGLLGGGGGGGGGVIYTQNVRLDSGYYGVTVGAGGKGAVGRGVATDADGHCYNGSCNGENSFFNGLVAIGGGAGGGYNGGGAQTHPDSTVKSHIGVAGGSGGGGGVLYPQNGSNRDQVGGAGTSGQGNAGAKSFNRRYNDPTLVAGGGGGGAGAAAIPPGTNELGQVYGSDGGDGRQVSIWGNRYWGGGGAGSACQSVGVACKGGKGGGGDSWAGRTPMSGCDGEPNTGGGGGAATSDGWDTGHDKGQLGGSGGSGVVIIRFRSVQIAPVVHEEPVATGGKIRRRGGYAIHCFLADGTFTVNEATLVDVLVVGGGGGGGESGGGGGGGGGVQVVSNLWVEAGSYAITVGQGGLGQTSMSNSGYPTSGTGSSVNLGLYSVFSVPGGGRGGFRRWCLPSNVGGAGGGGGAPYGASHDDSSNWDPFIAGAAGVEPYGFAGGASTNWTDKTVEGYKSFKQFSDAGGGGGGAAGPGGNAWYEGIPSSSNRAQPGKGGAGVWCDFSGEMVEYGAGGDGGAVADDTSMDSALAGVDGVPGTGRGGGGATQGVDTSKKGGDGGCGCVIIRYLVRPRGNVILMR